MICISIGNIEQIVEVNSIRPALVEIRYDLLDDLPPEVTGMLDSGIRHIATCRPEGYSETERMEVLKSAIDKGASYVDVETESSDAFISEIRDYAKNAGCELIISYHNFDITPEKDVLESILSACYKKGADVAKIACMVRHEKDIAHLLSLYSADGRKVILGMGEKGKITRIAATEMGAEFTFVSLSEDETTAPGQLTLKEFGVLKKII